MTSSEHDAGLIKTLIDRYTKYRLPRAMELKAHVDSGGTLGEHDLQFLERVFHEAHNVDDVIERHPDIKPLVAKSIALYHEITSRALENEKAAERNK